MVGAVGVGRGSGMAPNPYKASCCQEVNDSLCEKVRHFFARPSAHLWPVDSLCLNSAPWFREQKQSCTKHVLRFRPPDVSGGCARSCAWRHRETRLCPYAVPVHAAGVDCRHAVQFVPGSGKGQHRPPGVGARGEKIEERHGLPINAIGCRADLSAHAPLGRAHGPRACSIGAMRRGVPLAPMAPVRR